MTPRLLASLVVVAAGVLACARTRATNEGQAAPAPPASPDSMKTEELSRQQSNSLRQLFEGRFPGVIVRPAGAGISVQIRGVGGTSLYIVDGMEVQPGPGGTLSWLRPGDIESIQVLKDPGDLALYGSRGGSGVIIIKTKGAH